MNSELLERLYYKMSKHAHYQKLSPLVEKLFYDCKIKPSVNRFESERFCSIESCVELVGSTILDVGGNTGYFSFESIRRGCNLVHYYEGNPEHCEFVKLAATMIGVSDRLNIYNKYFQPSEEEQKVDLIYLLNVLHHIGDDFGIVGDEHGCLASAADMLRKYSSLGSYLVFQIGYNWKGDPNKPLFKNGSKSDVIEWLESVTAEHWDVISTLIAVQTSTGVTYLPKDDENIIRNDDYGEFLNRPIFILKSKIC
ncbi:class I SAM-dependent methyltransferase [Aeromonas hydrophila]|uniref:class I SAM-dependent methyltransferase n=1 Tax=Aeromonas hydrophila TaxID=644 RepID=UPI00256EEBAE|nr:class I SAM-dependent methyltransferase [Aeromonas hydrophila]MDL5385543.1 class I SAM-dependent methyltransferase [Aeromonas hydrophila]